MDSRGYINATWEHYDDYGALFQTSVWYSLNQDIPIKVEEVLDIQEEGWRAERQSLMYDCMES